MDNGNNGGGIATRLDLGGVNMNTLCRNAELFATRHNDNPG